MPQFTIGSFLAIEIVIVVLVLAPVGARVWHNSALGQRQHLDDYLAVAATFFLLVSALVNYFEQQSSVEQLSAATPEQALYHVKIVSQWLIADFSIAIVAVWFSKAPLLLLYIRMFGVKNAVRYTCYATLIVSAIAYFTVSTYLAAVCNPFRLEIKDEAHFDRYKARCTALYARVGFIPACSLSIFQDVLNLALPIPLICSLNLNRRKKIGLAFVFAWGTVAVAASILSLLFHLNFGLQNSAYAFYIEQLLSLIDCGIAIIVSCVPSMHSVWVVHVVDKPFYSKMASFFPKISLFGSNSAPVLQRPSSYIQQRSSRHDPKTNTDRRSKSMQPRTNPYIELREGIP
ncbi:hypothetical protein GGR57DRAFT_480119 [Xylariaceae sp. FL1272]|nr:hypothetical protein GGR57DRAFT_480119 [Xylariaceae sp. FL1272]